MRETWENGHDPASPSDYRPPIEAPRVVVDGIRRRVVQASKLVLSPSRDKEVCHHETGERCDKDRVRSHDGQVD